MSKSRKWLWVGLPLAVLGGVALGHFWENSPSSQLSTTAVQALAADGMTPINPKPASNFQLVNQNNQPVSLRQFRGKAVVMTFLDPVCYWDCPLEAQELIDMDRVLGPKLASHVEILAVVANPSITAFQTLTRLTQNTA
jgi:cytochrome oxidase Cu insertion factor (SCO1/SenC/PrrC family)